MPYKSERIPIQGTVYDKRRTLSLEQIRAIKILNEQGYSQRKLAAMFGCSKRSVQNILHPQQRSKPKKRSTAYWTEAKKQYRRRKQELYQTGKINENRKRKHRTSDKPP